MEVALITGCATGIGRALAEDLNSRSHACGTKQFKVYASDYRLEALQDLQSSRIEAIQLDVRDEQSIKSAIRTILSREGRIDLLVCNAGLAAAGWMTEVPIEHLERMFDVNVLGIFRVVQAVAPFMMDRRAGKIATFSSVNSYVATAFGGPYAGSKAAVAMMTEALRIELEPFNITVTSVIPGFVRTQIMSNALLPYDRYESHDSHFHQLMPVVRESRTKMASRGISTHQAANDISKGLSQNKPSRFLYTGNWVVYSLLSGLLQMWICSGFVAKNIQKTFCLDQVARLGRGGGLRKPMFNSLSE